MSVLRIETRGTATVATIDDPTTRNAMTAALSIELTRLLDRLGQDRTARALVLRGNAKIFCAGADLKAAAFGPGMARAELVALNRQGGALFLALDSCPVPVIAVVEGAAMGGGLGLAACADIVLATDGARFALSEVRLGLIAAQIAPFVAGRIGVNNARRLALTGAAFGAADAKAIGLVDEIVSVATLDDRIDQILAYINEGAPAAIAASKALFRSLETRDWQRTAIHAADLFADAALADGAEGLAAFRERRKPRWPASR